MKVLRLIRKYSNRIFITRKRKHLVRGTYYNIGIPLTYYFIGIPRLCPMEDGVMDEILSIGEKYGFSLGTDLY